MRELNKSGILKNGRCSLVEPKIAEVTDLGLVHEIDYIHLVQQICVSGGGLLDLEDTMVSPETYEVARLAVGGTLKAVDLVMKGKFRNAFALVRPPGHHAGPYYAMGFCVFNNIAVAASHLLENFNLNRVLILDVDAHHGNGTQEIFYQNSKVLYISLHEDPSVFPLTGFAEEVGEDDGLGYTVNIPLPFGTNDRIYLKAFNEIVVPIITQYKPQFILVSTGFDNHQTDPVAELALSAYSYTKIFDTVLELASKFCQGKFVAILEGGYNLRVLGKLAAAVIARMAGIPYLIRDKRSGAVSAVRKKGEKMIEEVKKIQSSFWNIKS
uniref:Acetoin utilization protein n=1 Tax=uncultured miscellaneous Crenarchaeota group TaxID=1368239 RepID=W8RLV4_9ARCH|nr:acetoin utilization protein [uncultured miscellaneous Crenarchaeota group]